MITKKEIMKIIQFYQGMDYNPLGSQFRGLIARDILMYIEQEIELNCNAHKKREDK